MSSDEKPLKPGLYVTATPIGNLGDITYRAVKALQSADLILCEDTRQTAKLCAAYGIAAPRMAYHEHNAGAVRPGIIERLKDGARICLVSDAGTPLIADPGYKLVAEARAAGVTVAPLPGPSAFVAALSAAGAPTDRFTFAGFPPSKEAARRRFLEGLAHFDGAIVFYETANRLAGSLRAMSDAFGPDRRGVIARELTKLHEEFREGDLAALAASVETDVTKGEIVVIVHPAAPRAADADEIDAFLSAALETSGVKDAAAAAADALKIPRRLAYERALALKAGR